MDDAGNVLIRRYSKGNVYVKSTTSLPNEETAIGNDIMKLPSQALEMEKIVKVSIYKFTYLVIDLFYVDYVLFAALRYEEVPVQCKSGAQTCISRSSAS